MKRSPQGRTVPVSAAGERAQAFVPFPLPPEPPIEWVHGLRARFDAALVALGQLDAAAELLPNASLLLYSFVRKEAVLSSMIEGTQASLADLMLYELERRPGVPLADAREVSRCVAAIEHGVARLEGGFPLSMRLLREAHAVLLDYPGGARAAPGEIRRSQVWLGGAGPASAAFVPPPAHELADLLAHLERFLHDDPEPTTPLLKAALAHVQFETIHPFLDGNGRIGRLLITLGLIADGVLRAPLLYPSLYLKQHRPTYYALLDAVRRTGDWEAWLEFFADAITYSAVQAADSARRLHDLAVADRDSISTLGRAAPSALALHRAFEHRPLATPLSLAATTGLTPATVNKSLAHLERLGLLTELTGKKRDRVFCYARYAEILGEGMEPVA